MDRLVGLLWGAQIRSITGEMDFESLQVNHGTPMTAKDLQDATGDDLPGMGFSQIGLASNLGFGVALSPGFHLELVGIAGLDWTSLDSVAILAGTTDTLITQEGKGRGFTVGGRFGAYWTNPESGWQFGLEGEYTTTKSEIETSYLDVTMESNLVNSGVSLRGVLGSRF